MVLIFIRHGETILNKKNIIASTLKDTELTNEGKLIL